MENVTVTFKDDESGKEIVIRLIENEDETTDIKTEFSGSGSNEHEGMAHCNLAMRLLSNICDL